MYGKIGGKQYVVKFQLSFEAQNEDACIQINNTGCWLLIFKNMNNVNLFFFLFPQYLK